MRLFTALLVSSLMSVVAMAQKPSSSVDYMGAMNWECKMGSKGGATWTCIESQSKKKMNVECKVPPSLEKMPAKMTLEALYASCEAVVPVPPK